MSLPYLDLEMMYQRLRRKAYRLRHAIRFRLSEMRCALDLRHLHLFGELPGKRTPEETFAYRFLWVVAVSCFVGVLVLGDTGPAHVEPADSGVACQAKDWASA